MSDFPLGGPGAPPEGPPFPGAAPTPSGTAARTFVVGRFAICSIDTGSGDATVINLFDWEVSVNFDYADATAHGDRWKQKVFLDADWTARARGYVSALDAVGYIKAATNASGPVSMNFKGWSDTSRTTLLWAGTCFIARGRISVPMAMMEQEIELVSNGIPSAGSFF
jgi:hypothetical protein